MRSCEYVSTPVRGRTKLLTLDNICFRDKHRVLIPHHSPDLSTRAFYVTITFVDQKNGIKMDRRTQRRSGHPILCPVLRWASAVSRILSSFPDASPSTPINTFLSPTGSTSRIPSSLTLRVLRLACQLSGGFRTYGFNPDDLGNPSVRSGAAMALFLMNHSPARIMILGRWSSDAFLVYIRPQVLEWTHNMSADMTKFDNFTDTSGFDKLTNDDPAPCNPRNPPHHGRVERLSMPTFQLYH